MNDFALRKKYSYGTVMVDIENHRIVDILASRETKEVEAWLRTFPSLEIVFQEMELMLMQVQ